MLIRNYPVVFSPWFSCIFHFPSVPFVPSFRPFLLSRARWRRSIPVDQDAGWRGGHQSGWHAAPREAPAPWHRWGDETNIQQRYWQKKRQKKGIQCLHSCNMLQYVAMIRMWHIVTDFCVWSMQRHSQKIIILAWSCMSYVTHSIDKCI